MGREKLIFPAFFYYKDVILLYFPTDFTNLTDD